LVRFHGRRGKKNWDSDRKAGCKSKHAAKKCEREKVVTSLVTKPRSKKYVPYEAGHK